MFVSGFGIFGDFDIVLLGFGFVILLGSGRLNRACEGAWDFSFLAAGESSDWECLTRYCFRGEGYVRMTKAVRRAVRLGATWIDLIF